MRRLFLIIFSVYIFLVAAPISATHAQSQTPGTDLYYKAKVEKIIESGDKIINGLTLPYQIVRVKLLDGNLKNKEITIDHGMIFSVDKDKFVHAGQTVVVVQTIGPDNTLIYQIIDVYRLNSLIPFLILFAAAVILLSRWKGVGSIIGMMVSLLVIAQFIVPQILSGQEPLVISIIGCLVIMVVTIYLAHGFSHQTTIALASTFATLLLTGLLSVLFVRLASLTGLGSEDAYSLKLGPMAGINFKGLLLGGILIGALGVLDDVTTGLTASIFELHHANPRLSFPALISAGLRIGREHIASLVNTLVLAYAGASLPIFIILITNPNHYPFWSIINSEMIVEEIVRTLSGSFGLILAVPLTTTLAAWYLTQKREARKSAL